MPLVSVLMVFHRDTPFFRPAIASVLGQTLRDLELVLVDNGTGLPAEALGGAERDARVRWVRLARNEGIPGGHNAGVRAAQGEFIALLDYDDIARPERLERQVALLREQKSVGLVSSLAETIDEQGAVVGREFSLVEADAQRAYTQFAAPVVMPAYTGRRELFEALPYREIFPLAADFDFLARAAERTRLAAVPEVLLHYRRYAAQTTNARAMDIERSRCAIRLLTARRRASRSEDSPAVPEFCEAGSLAEISRECARRCAAEGFFALAAYHARRSLALEPTLANAVRATALGARILRSAPRTERRFAARLFFSGPVRALGVRPQ